MKETTALDKTKFSDAEGKVELTDNDTSMLRETGKLIVVAMAGCPTLWEFFPVTDDSGSTKGKTGFRNG